MKSILHLLTLVVVVFTIGGCNSTTATAPTDTAVTGVLDLNTLPPSVDVQTVASLKDREDVLVLDVRELNEYEAGHIPGVTLIPMGEVANRLNEIPTDQTVIVTCRTGNRSGQVADFLRQNGYTNIHNMAGGIVEWEAAGLPVEQ
jgi:phage shock protein E